MSNPTDETQDVTSSSSLGDKHFKAKPVTDELGNYHSLDTRETQEIDQKVKFEMAKFQHKMVLFGGLLNILAGIFVLYVLHEKTSLTILVTWFVALVIADALNFGFAFKNRNVTPAETVAWQNSQNAYHITIGLLCLAYGSVGILYTGHDFLYQLFVISFLQLAFVGFSFGTITDYKACIISNICLLIPFVGYRLIVGTYTNLTLGYDPNINISLCLSLLILATFLLIANYFGYKLARAFFFLSFENVALSQKLENANQFLEKRVKERTIELENSLQLVTYQATHDLLTDLPNQRLLLEHLQAYIDSAAGNSHKFAVACLSLNEIEKINDALGHQVGDKVIKTMALRMQKLVDRKSQLTDSDLIVALTRKDVFVILINHIGDDLEKYAEVFISEINKPVLYDHQSIKISASVGISVFPHDGNDTNSLLMNADAAMAQAKQQGGNSVNIYKSEINADVSKKLMMENFLHTALENNEFKLQYQPVIDLKTGKICSAEALIRWHNPILGFVSPMDFIPLAETNGLIIPLGEWVLKTAFNQVKKWHDDGFSFLKIAINLSAKQLNQKNLIEKIRSILNETGMQPQCIELELTETEAFRNETIPVLKQLTKMGFNLSIDDFGTGYSGLSNLKLFEIDTLKIDKSFVQDVPTSADSNTIVANTIDLAKKLGVKVIAEGVETKEQLGFLVQHECDMMQGYFFSKPVDPDAFEQLLRNT